jgi:hypothetical protein
MVLHTAPQFLQNQELQSEELIDKRAVFFLFTSLLGVYVEQTSLGVESPFLRILVYFLV